MKHLFKLLLLISLLFLSCERPSLDCYRCTQTETTDIDIGYTYGDKITDICGQTQDNILVFEAMHTYDMYKTINNQQVLHHFVTTCNLQ
jgi:hypothetical protein